MEKYRAETLLPISKVLEDPYATRCFLNPPSNIEGTQISWDDCKWDENAAMNLIKIPGLRVVYSPMLIFMPMNSGSEYWLPTRRALRAGHVRPTG